MLIGIVGLIGSGKDTVAERLVQKHGYIKDSFAKSLKDAVAAMFNWNREMLEGDTTASVPEVFESVAQVTQAMNDPRYDKDPAYRKKIEDKTMVATIVTA